ncbi:MAG TPA: DUF305 domain-containing protein [Gemmatimonadaceae bacterium]|nr:DUF305 domain-containing protein [Gemmatimonadaceae bacterium]
MLDRRSLARAIGLALMLAAPLAAQSPAREMGAPFHDPSRAFIDLMIPHHEMAVMMSEHAMPMLRTEAVKQKAREMAAKQRQEIAELKATRQALLGADSARKPMMGSMMQMMGTHQMRDTAARGAMRDSTHAGHQPGAQRGGMMPMMSGDHDRMFLQHMTAHHKDGIDMSVLAEDSQAAARVKQLAKKIRDGQERDVAEMRRLLGALPAAPAAGHQH